jgi:hypothetical protein
MHVFNRRDLGYLPRQLAPVQGYRVWIPPWDSNWGVEYLESLEMGINQETCGDAQKQ